MALSRAEWRRRILESPKWFIHKVLGQRTWDKGEHIVRSTLLNRRTAAKGCVGSSKTWHAAVAALAFLYAFRPSEVYCTAPTFRQVKKAMFKEIKGLHRRAKVNLGGRMLTTELKLQDDWFISGFSAKNPDHVQALHSKNILLIEDEDQGIEEDLQDAAENMMVSGNAHMLKLGNPSSRSGSFFKAFHKERARYHGSHGVSGLISISAMDTPNWKQNKNVFPGMITRSAGEEWLKFYGQMSDFCQVKIFANFAKGDPKAIIPLEWIEKARVREPAAPLKGETHLVVIGCDPSGKDGKDETITIAIRGNEVLMPTSLPGQDTQEIAGSVKAEMEDLGASIAGVDPIGIGQGVVDGLIHENMSVESVNVSESQRDPHLFADRRSELMWRLREDLDPNNPDALSLPDDDELAAQLSTIQLVPEAGKGRIKIEPKLRYKKRHNGKSHDRADALMIAREMRAAAGPLPSATVNPSPSSGAGGGGFRRLTDRFGLRRRL